MQLIAGSSDLDLYSKDIEWYANSGKMSNEPKAWMYVKSWLKNILDVSYQQFRSLKYEKVIVFIDCNPSFSAYTELALVASDKIILPCTADGSSVRALNNAMKIIYGIDTNTDEYIASFHKEMTANSLSIPKISMVIQNRNRTKTAIKNKKSSDGQKQTSEAFSGIRDKVKDLIETYRNNHPDIFDYNKNNNIVIDVKDCNALPPIISYNG